MAETENTGTGATGSGGDPSEKAAAEAGAKLAAAPRIVLAHHTTKRRAIPDTDQTEPLLHDPVTVNGEVNIPEFPPVYFPGLDEQKSGFTPLFVATIGGRPTRPRYRPADGRRFDYLTGVETAAGLKVTLDVDSAAEAVRAVLTQFAGIYKPAEEKKGA
jgi:hypothetical protein